MTRILVPCDFSKYNEKALNFALQLAAQIDGHLLLVNVVSESTSAAITSALKIHALESLTALVKSCQNSGIITQQKILTGRFMPSILKSVINDNIDLIVMGTHGSRGWDDFFLGSHIEKIVRTSPVPVFAVRGSVNTKSINDIVFPCDMKLNQFEMIEQIKLLQTLFHARLQILRINTGSSLNDEKIKERLEQYAKHYQLVNFRINVLKNKNVKDGILHFTSENNADMIAMITHRKRDLKHLFSQSTTADVVNHANVLVWTCCSEQLSAKTPAKNDD
ncbi:universal stress protein [Dyadobacter sp. 3J3]|uniref:universal stress protein n=1 Tax=Dyadobacter sp. 3J3 TaxID=2606600 RepID=UPI0013571F7E|nr:universal stress protein [Dyadobacter sp. 3J3]